MKIHDPAVLVVTALAFVSVMWIAGLFEVFFAAILATIPTFGLRTGSLAPSYPGVSRTDARLNFSLIIAFRAAAVIAKVSNILFNRQRLKPTPGATK